MFDLLCREACPLLPDRFEENLNALFTHMGTDPLLVPEDIRSIIEELERIL